MGQPAARQDPVRLITLDPGHFHAALVQKRMYPGVDPVIHVYAPAGDDVAEHLKRTAAFNTRAENPTRWKEVVYTGPDYLPRMLAEKPGNVVVLAGNNRQKTQYITDSVKAGLHVLADKPMAIDGAGFAQLEQAFTVARSKGVLLYDIMTERFEITAVLQKELSHIPELFGRLEPGTPDNPSVTKESVHHFFKYVSGVPLKRPGWAFDVRQQGEGIVDVTTHLVDLVQWECFPEQVIDYRRDVQVDAARRWPTTITAAEFQNVTGMGAFPDYLSGEASNGVLNVFANGEINYRIKGVHAKVSVIWNFRAPEGTGDTHFSNMRGTRCNLVIRQGAEQGYKPKLYVEPVAGVDRSAFQKALESAWPKVEARYPGVTLKADGAGWQVVIPSRYEVGHEAHFGQVTEQFLRYLAAGQLPEWEVAGMIAKYYTTTAALEKAKP